MQKIRQFAAVLLLLCCAFGGAARAEPKEGVQFLTLPQALPTDSGDRVEVIEFFAYYCPHCYAFEPLLAKWVKQQGDRIVFKRVHVPYNAAVAPQQRLFYTLQAMGLLEQYHQQVFDAMHQSPRQRLSSDEEVFDWAARHGIDRTRFAGTYRSFGVTAHVRRAGTMMSEYQIKFWPNIVIAGKYQTSPSQANEGSDARLSEEQQQKNALQVMDYLVTRARSEQK